MSTARDQSQCLNREHKQRCANMNPSSSGRHHNHTCSCQLPSLYRRCQGMQRCTLIGLVKSVSQSDKQSRLNRGKTRHSKLCKFSILTDLLILVNVVILTNMVNHVILVDDRQRNVKMGLEFAMSVSNQMKHKIMCQRCWNLFTHLVSLHSSWHSIPPLYYCHQF